VHGEDSNKACIHHAVFITSSKHEKIFQIVCFNVNFGYEKSSFMLITLIQNAALNPLTPELNPCAQSCLTRIFTEDFASLGTVHFFNICVKNQQIYQLFIQFINYVWYLLHVSALHCHPQGLFLVPSERYSIEEQSIEYCGWACCV
jgi:hypothetical protein